MISSIIYSRNRAMQLNLLLRSINDNFKELEDIYILYKATNEEFEKGYEKVISQFSHYNWIKENDFKKDTVNIASQLKNNQVVLFCDDEVIISDYSIIPAIKLLHNRNDLHTFSLRMYPEISYTYTANVDSPPPTDFERIDDFYIWNWRNYPIANAEWAYPSCINSMIYTKVFLNYFVNLLYYKNLNDLEGQMHLKRNLFRSKMVCYKLPKTINIANNLVQTGGNRHSDNEFYSAENLNKLFLNGEQISTKNLYNIICNTPTCEINYKFEKIR